MDNSIEDKLKKIHQNNPSHIPLIKWCYANNKLITQPCEEDEEEDITYDPNIYDLIFRVGAVTKRFFPLNASVEQFQFEKSIKNAINILNHTYEAKKIKIVLSCIKLPIELREIILEYKYKKIVYRLYLCI